MKNQTLSTICITLTALAILSACSTSKKNTAAKDDSMNNMVARMEVKEPIEGVCDNANVLVILPFPGNAQVKAKAPKTDEQLTLELTKRVIFLHDKPDYEDKGMVNIIINCKGEMVRCTIDNKSRSPELDNQILAVFAELKLWTPGTVHNKPVDTVELYSFTIQNGKITIS